MNRTAARNFAVWARNRLIADAVYKAGLLGISESGVRAPLPQSTAAIRFFDIGTREPYAVSGTAIRQRDTLARTIGKKAERSDCKTAFRSVMEEVAYTWFNRLIAVRFMEVNDYLPSHARILSSGDPVKNEPDLVAAPFDFGLDFSSEEKDRVLRLKRENRPNELFRELFIKQCNALNAVLPELFEKTNDYTELLLNVSFTDPEGVVYRLTHDIPEEDFDVSKEGQVEIIGWLYQYYNSEPKDEAFALLKKGVKISKERIPAATQLFTPDWIVRYMVENSLGRLWLEGRPNVSLKSRWRYYLDEAEQLPDTRKQLEAIREKCPAVRPEKIRVIDPCMGSGHILVYAFDVLIGIYESCGYSDRDAARSILAHNLYGLDVDPRAYQLAYFAVMMKARQYDRRILSEGIRPNLCAVRESDGMDPDCLRLFDDGPLRSAAEKLTALFADAGEYGSIINVDIPLRDLAALERRVDEIAADKCGSLFDRARRDGILTVFAPVLRQAVLLTQKYDVAVTNPPYVGAGGMDAKLSDYVKRHYPDGKNDLFAVFMEKCVGLTKDGGYLAMITQQSWMFLSRFEKLRERLMQLDIVDMIHLGAHAFNDIGGEVVRTAAFVLRRSNVKNYRAVYVRLTACGGQQEKQTAFLDGEGRYTAQKESFARIPGKPAAYWADENIIRCFENRDLESYAHVRQGLACGDVDRFRREWYEVAFGDIGFGADSVSGFFVSGKKYAPINDGGPYRKWYGNNGPVLRFDRGSYSILQNMGNRLPSRELYFKQGITWTAVTSKRLSLRYFGGGFLFSNAGMAVFGTDKLIKPLCALLNSNLAAELLAVINESLNFNRGDIARVPVPANLFESGRLAELTDLCIRLEKDDWDESELSWDFKRDPLVRAPCRGKGLPTGTAVRIETRRETLQAERTDRFIKLRAAESEINSIVARAYRIRDSRFAEVRPEDVTLRQSSLRGDIVRLISYSVGCMFGRYSLDTDGLAFAGGKWDAGKYRVFLPDRDNIIPITDEEYFKDDIVGRFVEFIREAFGAAALQDNLDSIAGALGGKGNGPREVIRNYFLKDFYKDHVKAYRKRPIYWLFDSGKENGFKALVYVHRYDENTIGNLRADYLHRMQRVYEREIERMRETAGGSDDAREIAAAEKRGEKLTRQLKEVKDYDEKIAHLALARIPVDLDDGIKVNYEKVQTGADGKKLEVLAQI